MPDRVPRPAAGLWIEDLEDEIVILVGDTDQVHTLNETAAEIWRLVDGARTEGEIAAAFAASYPELDPAELAADAAAVLSDLAAKGLLLP